jgi:hypothetical protein
MSSTTTSLVRIMTRSRPLRHSTHTTPEAQAAMDRLEAAVRQERSRIPDVEIDVDLMPWILDTGSIQAGETKYFRTMDLYWHIKTLLSKAIIDKVAAPQRACHAAGIYLVANSGARQKNNYHGSQDWSQLQRSR